MVHRPIARFTPTHTPPLLMNLMQIWSERRKIVLLGLLVLLLVVLLARQEHLIPPGPAGDVVRAVAYPLVVAVHAVDDAVTGMWVLLMRSKELRAENAQMKTELALLRVRYQQLAEAYTRLEQVSKLTAARPAFDLPNVTASVVGISANFWTRTVLIDRGRRDGVAPDMPVVNQDGLVGIVRDATQGSALVQLLIDPVFAAGVLVRETRDRGVVQGTGEPDRLRLILENPQTPLEVGYEVITSGLPPESLFPKGFVIGAIVQIEQDESGQRYAQIRPAVRFDRLEEVVVLLETRPTEPQPQPVLVPPP